MSRTEDLKALLRRLPLAERVNATLKGASQTLEMGLTARRLAARAAAARFVYNEHHVAAKVRERLARRGLTPVARDRGELRILWMGAYEAQDKTGTLQGLAKLGEVVCLHNEHGYGVGRASAVENGKTLVATAKTMGRVDLVCGNVYGVNVDPEALREVGRMGAVVTNYSMDDRHFYLGHRLPDGRYAGPSGLIPGLDLALTTTRETCARYELDGCPALWFPMASDPEIFRPRPEIDKDIEVSFIGLRYGIREALVSHLRSRGIRVEAWGKGWDNGILPDADVPGVVARSRICLGVGTIRFTGIMSPKLRDYDMPMAGAAYLTHYAADLAEHFVPGVEIDTYRTVEECALKARYYLDHPEVAAAMGRAGRLRALRDHTWESRFTKLAVVCGVLRESDRERSSSCSGPAK